MALSAAAQIAAEIRDQIASGKLAPGDLVPSAREISRRWRVAIATASRVHALLRDAGLAETLPGVGVVVRRPSKGPANGPLRTAIVIGTAVTIADAEGLDAVSMRRLASELRTTPMALYRHVADKDALTTAMLNAALGEWRAPLRGAASRRDRLEAAARGLWEQFRRHPWLAGALSLTRPQALPSAIAWTEWVLEALDELDVETRFDVYLTVFSFVRGVAVNLGYQADEHATTGLDTDAWVEKQRPDLEALADPATAPQFAQVLAAGDYDFSLDRIFELGLELLLDGLEARLS